LFNFQEEMMLAQPKITRREKKAHRILDAAADLTLRRGYDNTSMDAIAQHAGVAKGTLYLYWKTREDLFRTLVKRERLKWAEDFTQRVAADPEGITLNGIYQHAALGLMKQPLLKAILIRDMEILGKLAHSEESTAASLERIAGFESYLQALRQYGIIRSDMELGVQVYTVSAILMGFFLVAPLVPDEMTPSDEAVAQLIGETIQRTLESGRVVAVDELKVLHTMFMQFMNNELEITKKRFQQELVSGAIGDGS
jgi:AcrR family transcriptional regulator